MYYNSIKAMNEKKPTKASQRAPVWWKRAGNFGLCIREPIAGSRFTVYRGTHICVTDQSYKSKWNRDIRRLCAIIWA